MNVDVPAPDALPPSPQQEFFTNPRSDIPLDKLEIIRKKLTELSTTTDPVRWDKWMHALRQFDVLLPLADGTHIPEGETDPLNPAETAALNRCHNQALQAEKEEHEEGSRVRLEVGKFYIGAMVGMLMAWTASVAALTVTAEHERRKIREAQASTTASKQAADAPRFDPLPE